MFVVFGPVRGADAAVDDVIFGLDLGAGAAVDPVCGSGPVLVGAVRAVSLQGWRRVVSVRAGALGGPRPPGRGGASGVGPCGGACDRAPGAGSVGAGWCPGLFGAGTCDFVVDCSFGRGGGRACGCVVLEFDGCGAECFDPGVLSGVGVLWWTGVFGRLWWCASRTSRVRSVGMG